MNPISKFFAEASFARKLMLGVIVLVAVSQFFPYQSSDSSQMIGGLGNTLSSRGSRSAGGGWDLHPQAGPLLLLLLGFFASPLAEDTGFGRFGWWLSVVLVFACLPPGSIDTLGMQLGTAGFVGALLAAIIDQVMNRKPAAPKAPPVDAPKP